MDVKADIWLVASTFVFRAGSLRRVLCFDPFSVKTELFCGYHAQHILLHSNTAPCALFCHAGHGQ
jgi:hypothetical protein